MKIRSGFVSNSSSSSFIIIGNGKFTSINKNPAKYGEHKFDYGMFRTFSDKFNFLMIECYYSKNFGIEMRLKDFCRKYNINFDEQFDKIKKLIVNERAWIDHQSIIDEDSSILRIFETEESLERFLLCPNTLFYLGRD